MLVKAWPMNLGFGLRSFGNSICKMQALGYGVQSQDFGAS